jgi:hypothetical protein
MKRAKVECPVVNLVGVVVSLELSGVVLRSREVYGLSREESRERDGSIDETVVSLSLFRPHS